MRFAVLFLLFCCFCDFAPVPAKQSTLIQVQCSSAIANDDGDDTVAVQAAINTKCCLGPGIHDIAMATSTTPNGRRRYDMLTVDSSGELCGVGPSTILRFHGDAKGQDWRGVEQTGGSVHDIAIETGDLIGTSEQTHAHHVTGPASVTIERVTYTHPIRHDEKGVELKGGDCIDLVGYAPDRSILAHIRDNLFLKCDRGGIQAHSGIIDLEVIGNEFRCTGDLDFNSEGSGGSKNWRIVSNRFLSCDRNQGAFSVALDLVDNVVLANNYLERGIYLYNGTNCKITGNQIIGQNGNSDAAGVIEATKASNDLTISDNAISRTTSLPPGPVIHISPHGTQPAQNVRIIHNRIEQATVGDIVYVEGISGLRLDDNILIYSGPSGKNIGGFHALGSGGDFGTPATSMSLTGNTFTGPLRAAVLIAGAAGRRGIGSLLASWNSSESPGLVCENLSGITGPLFLIANSWPGGSCGVPSLASSLP